MAMIDIKHNKITEVYRLEGKVFKKSSSYHPTDLQALFGKDDLKEIDIIYLGAAQDALYYKVSGIDKMYRKTPERWSEWWLSKYTNKDVFYGLTAMNAMTKQQQWLYRKLAEKAIGVIKSGKETVQNIIDNGEGNLLDIEPLKSFLESSEAKKYIYGARRGGSDAKYEQEEFDLYKQIFRIVIDEKFSISKACEQIAENYQGLYKNIYEGEDLKEYLEKVIVKKYNKINGLRLSKN